MGAHDSAGTNDLDLQPPGVRHIASTEAIEGLDRDSFGMPLEVLAGMQQHH
jgi:hypothetical protein